MSRQTGVHRKPPSSTIATTYKPQAAVEPHVQTEQSIDKPTAAPHSPTLIHRIVALQRTVGNRQAAQLLGKQAQAPRNIQRMLMTENSVYSSVSEGIANDEERQKFLNHSDFRSFSNALRIYDQFTRNKFKRADIKTLKSMLDPVIAKIQALDDLGFRMRRSTDDNLKRTLVNALDDVAQEQQAIGSISTDMTIPDGALTFRQALFFARSGTAFSSVLTDNDLAPDPNGGEAGSPTVLGAGNVSSVMALTYNRPGGQERMAFKGNEEKPGQRDDTTDIDFNNVQSAMRAVASARIQMLIQQKMVAAGQQFTSLIGNFNFAMYKGVLGTAATIAEGHEIDKPEKDENGRVSGFTSLNIDVNDITLQKQLANLQLFDVLTGQGDRNMGNIMVSQKTGQQTKVQGIDQDFAFSEDKDVAENVGKTTMPQYVDRYFAEGILAISDAELLGAMKGLAKTSRDSTLARFAGIKAQLRQMDGANQLVVAPGDVNHPGAPTWATIDTTTYRKSSFNSGKKDYAGTINTNTKDAKAAVKKNPSLKPKQIQKGSRQIWVLETSTMQAYRARNDDGSDLFALVREALDELKRERNFAYTGPNRQRAGFQMGSRKPVKAK